MIVSQFSSPGLSDCLDDAICTTKEGFAQATLEEGSRVLF